MDVQEASALRIQLTGVLDGKYNSKGQCYIAGERPYWSYYRPNGRKRTYQYKLPTSTGWEHALARELNAPEGGLRSRAQGTATSAMRSGLTGNSERRGRARSKFTCDAGTKSNGKCACEMKRNGARRHLPKCSSREDQKGY
eukprot:3352499-Pleurochrysis_carterae.AAC.3